MRKLLFPFVIVLIFSLCSCEKSSTVKPVTQNIGFTAETLWNGTDYQITAVTDGDLKAEFTVVSPEKIRNFKLAFSGDTVDLHYFDLEHKFSVTELADNSPLRVIYEALKAADSEDARVLTEDDNLILKFSVGDSEYRLFLGETGLPLKITDKAEEKNIIFKNVSIHDEVL